MLAGPHGCGKTAWLACNSRHEHERLGIAQHFDLCSAAEESESGKAASVPARVLRQIRATLAQRRSFGLETTLADDATMELLRAAQEHGYRITLVFVGTSDPSIAAARVAQRRAAGGRGVAEEELRRSYEAGLANLPRVASWASSVRMIESSDQTEEAFREYARALAPGQLRLRGPLPRHAHSTVEHLLLRFAPQLPLSLWEIERTGDRDVYRGTDVPVNHFRARTRALLTQLELDFAYLRVAEALAFGLSGAFGPSWLRSVAEHLFGDVYEGTEPVSNDHLVEPADVLMQELLRDLPGPAPFGEGRSRQLCDGG